MNTDQLKFGDFVKDKRQKKGITLKTMAKRLGLSITYWRDIENNRRNPVINKIEAIIQLFNLPLEEQYLLNDLVGKARKEVPPDLAGYIMDAEVASGIRTALREAKQKAVTQKDENELSKNLGKQ